MDSASSNISDLQRFGRCYNYSEVTHVASFFCATNILFVCPIYFAILHLGFQHWKKCCFPSSAPTTRQSDLFTYNMVAMGFIEIPACCLYCVGTYTAIFEVADVGFFVFYVCWFVKMLFHTLTCIECYLAVVHPVTYLGLKNETGGWIRAIVIGWVWLYLVFLEVLTHFMTDFLKVLTCVTHVVLSFIVMLFCCVSVLWALKRPGPGQAGCDRKHINQTKRRAFYTILTIMSTLLFSLVWMMVSNVLYTSLLLNLRDKCLIIVFVTWVSLPCNLVLPILYLQREGKLPRFKQNSQLGEFPGDTPQGFHP